MKYLRKTILYHLLMVLYVVCSCFAVNQVWGSRCHSLKYFFSASYWLHILYPKGDVDTEIMWVIAIICGSIIGAFILSAKSFKDEMMIFTISIIPFLIISVVAFTLIAPIFELIAYGDLLIYILSGMILLGLAQPPVFIIFIIP